MPTYWPNPAYPWPNSNLLGNLEGPCKWTGGVLGPDDNTIWGIPADSEDVFVLNCRECTFENFKCAWANPGTRKWSSGVLAPNGIIFGVPSSATKILAIDTKTRTSLVFGELEAEFSKWSCGVLGPDKHTVFFVPSNSEFVLAVDTERYLEIDPVTNSPKPKITEFGIKQSALVSLPIRGDCKWCGGALGPDNKTIFCLPSNAKTILAINTEDYSVEMFGDLGDGTSKWSGAVVGPDGKTLFGIPMGSEQVLALNMEDRSIELFGRLPGKRKWKGGALGPDGAIYGVPAGHACMLQIHTSSRTANIIPGGFKDEPMWPGWKWSGGFVHPGTGTLFCIPTNAHSVLAFGPIPDGKDPEPGDGHNFRAAGLSLLRTGNKTVLQKNFSGTMEPFSPKHAAKNEMCFDKEFLRQMEKKSRSASLPRMPPAEPFARFSSTSRGGSAAPLPGSRQSGRR